MELLSWAEALQPQPLKQPTVARSPVQPQPPTIVGNQTKVSKESELRSIQGKRQAIKAMLLKMSSMRSRQAIVIVAASRNLDSLPTTISPFGKSTKQDQPPPRRQQQHQQRQARPRQQQQQLELLREEKQLMDKFLRT